MKSFSHIEKRGAAKIVWSLGCDQQTRGKPRAALQTPLLLTYSLSNPLVPTALQRRHAQTVRDRCSSYKIDYVIVIKIFLNTKGHQNPICGSKVTAILLKGSILPTGGASAGQGLRLQSAQQACLLSQSVQLLQIFKKKMDVVVPVLTDHPQTSYTTLPL